MRLTRTLAYGGENPDRRPRLIRKLAYATAFLLPLVTSFTANALPARDSAFERIRDEARAYEHKVFAPKHARELKRRTCGNGLDEMLQPGERVIESKCRFGNEFVLTDRSLLRVYREPITEGNLTLNLQVTRMDMKDLNAGGVADWEPTEDSVFVLTKDRMLIRIPNEGMGETVPAYPLSFDTSSLGRYSMAYQSGILFIAPRGMHALAMTFEGARKIAILQLRSPHKDAGFFFRGSTLIYGKPGVEETAVLAEGGLDSLRYVKTK
jgi:hypothetical protein